MLPVGDDTTVKTRSQAYVMGYSLAILWLGTFEHLADAGTVELTSISRVFSARNGRKLGGLQTDADLIHGNRGGLVPDDERALWPIAVPVLGPPGVGESPQIL